MGINSSYSESKNENFNFEEHDLRAIRGLAYNELNQIPLDEDLSVVNMALDCLVKNQSIDSKLEATLSSSIKTRVKALQQIMDECVELSYVHPEHEKDFKTVILSCVQEKIIYFNEKQKQLKKLSEHYEKEKLSEMKDQLAEMDPKLQEEALKSIQGEALQKAKEEISKSQKEDQKIYLEQKAEFDAKKAEIGKRAASAKNFYKFIKKELDKDRIGAEWPMEALVGHEPVITHYLVLKNILSREEFLKLKVFEFLQLGKESLQPAYQGAKEELNQPTLTVEQIKQIVAKQDFIKQIQEGTYDHIRKLIKDHTNNREVMLAAVKRYGILLQHASVELRGDREIVLEAVKQEGHALTYASSTLKRDKKLILEAVKQNSAAFSYSEYRLKRDKEFILEAVKINGDILDFVSSDLTKDKEFMLQAVKLHERALKYASKDLQDDRDFVLAAVSHYGNALRYASKELQADREIVLTAIKQNGEALYWASEELQNDQELDCIAYESCHRLGVEESEI